MDSSIVQAYIQILQEELVPALGCTEPIAIAYAGAKVREVLGRMPDAIEVFCSGNIVKNVKGVTVPNSGGLRGIEAAAILGVVGGDAGRQLEVLEAVSEPDIRQTEALLKQPYCTCHLAQDVDNLYVRIAASAGGESACVELQSHHTHITEVTKNGRVLFSQPADGEGAAQADKSLLNVRDIFTFAQEADLSPLEDTLERQIQMNTRIAQEGLSHPYGTQVGRTLLKHYDPSDVRVRARALAAAGSDARMNGCPLPVVINSGSGNQGMTVSLPIITYAEALNAGRDTLHRALALGNLIAILQK